MEKLLTGPPQFRVVSSCQVQQKFFPTYRQIDHYRTAVGCGARPSNQAFCFQPVYQFYGAVMSNLQALRQYSDRHNLVRRQSLNRKQRLMLLWLYTCCMCRMLAEVYKSPNLIPEVRQ